jgi:hypothetical protein
MTTLAILITNNNKDTVRPEVNFAPTYSLASCAPAMLGKSSMAKTIAA